MCWCLVISLVPLLCLGRIENTLRTGLRYTLHGVTVTVRGPWADVVHLQFSAWLRSYSLLKHMCYVMCEAFGSKSERRTEARHTNSENPSARNVLHAIDCTFRLQVLRPFHMLDTG